MSVDIRKIREKRRLGAVEALAALEALKDGRVDGIRDLEAAHYEADAILLSLLESYPLGTQIVEAFDAIPKWYS